MAGSRRLYAVQMKVWVYRDFQHRKPPSIDDLYCESEETGERLNV